MEALPCARSAVKLEEGISGFKESFQDSFFLCQLGLSEVGIEGHLRKKEKKNTERWDSLYKLDKQHRNYGFWYLLRKWERYLLCKWEIVFPDG